MPNYKQITIDGMNPSCRPTVNAIEAWYKYVGMRAPSQDYIKRNTYFVRCSCCKSAENFDSIFSCGKFEIWCLNKHCALYRILSEPEVAKLFPRWRWKTC